MLLLVGVNFTRTSERLTTVDDPSGCPSQTNTDRTRRDFLQPAHIPPLRHQCLALVVCVHPCYLSLRGESGTYRWDKSGGVVGGQTRAWFPLGVLFIHLKKFAASGGKTV